MTLDERLSAVKQSPNGRYWRPSAECMPRSWASISLKEHVPQRTTEELEGETQPSKESQERQGRLLPDM